METILVPTDFSNTSKNAAEYAMEIAKQIKANIILFHVFHIPIVASDVPVVVTSFDDLEKNSMQLLKKYEKELISKHGNKVPIQSIVKPGFIVDEVKDLATEKKVDLIVMGITGNGKFTEVVIGSNATGVINNVNCATLVIPQNTKYKKIKNIAFACDYEEISDSPALKKLKTFLQLFNANLMIFNVVDPDKQPSFAHAVTGVKLENIFENVNHSLYFPEGDDFVFAINEFVDKHEVDILVMIPKKHNLFANMFQRRNTKKMAFHTHVPLLAIHD